MRQKAFALITTCLTLALAFPQARLGEAAVSQATLKAVTLTASPPGSELFLRLEGTYTFKTVHAASDSVWVDLIGATAGAVPRSGRWSDSVVGGYRLIGYTEASGLPVLRIQLEIKHDQPFVVRQERVGLRVFFGAGVAAAKQAGGSQAPAQVAVAIPPRVERAPVMAAATPSKGPAAVTGIAVRPGLAGETYVDISTSQPAAYKVFRLDNPSRLVVDLDGAHHYGRARSYAGQGPLLRGVRVAQFSLKNDGVVRVVADLAGDPVFDVHAQAGGVRIELKARQLVRAPVPAPTPAPTRLVAAKAAEPAVPTVSSVVPAPPAVSRQPSSTEPQTEFVSGPTDSAPAAAATPDYQTALPAVGADKGVSATPRAEAPKVTPESLQALQAARTIAATTQTLPQGQGQAPAAMTAAGEEKPKYTGETISLNLKDVDLKDFFRLIHEISGLNIIVDPNVAGTVTLVLDAVPWDQALDIVLKNNGLGRTMEGNVLRIAKMETLTAEAEQIKRLAAARDEAMPLVTVFRPVNYAKAATLASLLKSWVGGGALTKRGNILVDDRTNTLIISDIQSQVPIIDSIITKLDKKAKQVYIEARIVRANADFVRNLSGALTVGTMNTSGSTITSGATGDKSSVTTSTEERAITVTQATASGFGVYAVSNAGARYIINAAIAAAETKSQAKVISAPAIVTQNNVPGNVLQGTQIPIQTTINNTISVQYVQASLELKVTPQVTEDGNVFLVINVRNASPGAILSQAGPSINTQEATTQVLVPDGGTVVFGGVNVTTRSRSATYVPLLGSIPILGHLFKTSNVTDSDQQLLFFVSPKVMPG
jgi:type IV pilus assembly protein PilQ